MGSFLSGLFSCFSSRGSLLLSFRFLSGCSFWFFPSVFWASFFASCWASSLASPCPASCRAFFLVSLPDLPCGLLPGFFPGFLLLPLPSFIADFLPGFLPTQDVFLWQSAK